VKGSSPNWRGKSANCIASKDDTFHGVKRFSMPVSFRKLL
jgi:hypothetical protein